MSFLTLLIACTQVSQVKDDVLEQVPPEAVPEPVREVLPTVHVDAYVTAGFDSPARTCHYSRKGTASGESCALYRVRVDLSKNASSDVRTVFRSGDAGTYQPALSPDATRIVYVRASRDGGEVQVRPVDASPESFGLTVSAPGSRSPQFPSWLDADTVLYSATDHAAACKTPDGGCTSIDRWGDVWKVPANGGPSTIFRGSGATGGGSFKDPKVADGGRLVTSHGEVAFPNLALTTSCDAADAISCNQLPVGEKPVPQVSDATDGRTWWFKLENDEPGRVFPLEGCAHTSLNPSGTQLLCTEQKTAELDQVPLTNRIYGVPFSDDLEPGSHTVKVKPLFAHPAPESVWPLPAGQTCSQMIHKYAEFCGDDSHVIATVACDCETPECTSRTSGESPFVPFSRIFLIDIEDPAKPVYTDLTESVERAVGVEKGTLHSFTATCSAALSEAGAAATPPAPIPPDAVPRERARGGGGQPVRRPDAGGAIPPGGTRPRPGGQRP